MGGTGASWEEGSRAELQNQSFGAVAAVLFQKGQQAWRAAPAARDPRLLSRPPAPTSVPGGLLEPQDLALPRVPNSQTSRPRHGDVTVWAHRLQVPEPGSACHRQVPLPPQAALCPFYRWVSRAFLRRESVSLAVANLGWPSMQRHQGLPWTRGRGRSLPSLGGG